MAKDTFDAIQSGQYKSNGNYRKKKKYETDFDAIQDGSYIYNPDIQKSKRTNVEENDDFFDNWFKAGAFSDGYQFGDVSKTILGSAADVGLGVVEGIMSGGEGIGDWLSYRTADVLDLFGGEDAARSVRENANINATNELFNVIKKKGNIEDNSVFGTKADSISNAMGTILTMTATAGLGGAAGLGTVGQTALSMGTMGIGSAGSGESEALQSGATPDEARLYGTISGAGEVFSEMLFGGLGKGAKAIGISKGLSSADDMLAKAVSDKFKSRVAKNLTQYGIKAGAEGLEEVISGIIQATGKKLTYMSEEEIGKLLQNEELLDQFIVGAISSGISQTPGLVKTTAKGQDFLTGYTKNEQKVYDTVLNERIEEAQKESKKPLTRKQLNTIEEEVKNDFENGYIGTKKIENTLGIGEIYNNLKNDTELAFGRELSKDELRDIENETKEKYADLIKDDNLIRRNYYEDSLKSQQYSADINQYDEKLRNTVQRAIDSGILNNSTKTHQFVDLLAKISADKGVTFDFTNNEALKNSSLGIDGATVNGYVNANGDITLNINSKKALDSVVGHEITHVLEGSDLYQALSDSIKEYAQSTGEYEKRLTELNKLYENVEGADIQKELTADLVGDYLFTNQEFVNHLTQNRNLFQKIYDEIKYLVKQVTAGSDEQRKLNKAMKMFEKAYKDNSVKLAEQENTKYSITKDNGIQAINDYINSNNYVFNNNGVLTVNNLNDKQIKDLVKIYHTTGYEDVNTDYLVNRLKEGNMPLQREIADRFIEKELGFKPTIDTTQIFEDAEGNLLTKEQVEFYKDSGVRDIRGRLIPVYHRTNADFTVFDEKAGTQHGKKYGKGFYFSTTPENYGNNTMKVYLNAKDGEFKYVPKMGYYIVQEPNMIKNVDNKAPTNNSDIRYSLSTDSNGRELTEQQQEYFKDSKARDENGNLEVVYHGTNNAGFNIFNKNFNYYTNNQDIAQSYTGGTENASFKRLESINDAKSWLNGVVEDLYIEGNNVYDYDGDTILEYSTNEDLLRNLQYDIQKMYGNTNAGGYYEGYVNITNPLIIDVKGDKWSGIDINNIGIDNPKDFLDKYGSSTFKENGAIRTSTNDIVSAVLDAIDEGELNYDGVIFKNIIDEGMYANNSNNSVLANDYVTFNSNQFKNVNNTTPTSDPDIRYSLTQDNKGRNLTEGQNDYFINSKTRDNNGNLITYYNGGGEYTVFDKTKMSDASKWGKGIYLTEYRDIANMYGNNVKEVYVNIENPLSDRLKTITFEQYNNLSKALYDEEAYEEEYDMYSNDLDLLWDITNKGNWADYSQQLKEYTGKDGIIINRGEPREDMVIAFDSSQVKNVDNLNPTDNEDINMSLSQQNEIAPTRQPGLTYGEDIALAPVQEQVSALQEDIAAIREDYRQQSEDIKNELRQLRAEREEMSRGIYENAPSINDIAPTQESSYYENTFAPELSDDLLKKYKSYFKSEFGLKGKQLNEAMEGIKELSTNPNLTARDVYNYLKENYGKEEIRNYNSDIQEVKSELRNTAIGVDEQTKKDIASMYDTYGKFRKAYLGKLKLVEYDGKNGIDSIYKDLSNKYPQLFNEDTISNTADQLMQLAEVTKMDNYTSMFEDLPEEQVRNDAAELYSMIRDYRNETAQRLAEKQVPDSYYDNIVPTEEIPYEEQLENRINELQNDLDLIPRKEYYAIQDRTIEDEIREVPEKKDITGLLNDQYQRKADRVEKSKPVIAKEKTDLRRGIDTLKTLFTNRNAEIDNLSRETGNKNIKFAGDMLNNYSAEAQNDIQIAQTDNYGKAIGKSIQEIFKPAKEGGLEQAFNDYLINYSNIDRWEAGKGSATPLDISQRLVANYESKYPQFKRWAVDVWKYGKNARNNMLESGLINQDTYNMLEERYPHYVPYISDSNNFDATIDKMTELKARPIKRARGGATELYPIEEALNRYTFAQKRALRTNNLYKEIVNELLKVKNESPIGADLRTDYTDLKENLYRDDTGNYLTAYDEGVRKSVQISDDLFKALSNDLENRIKDIEQRLSIITKPLQKASDFRRKILTSWSPSFPVKNALKDIQDASLNSTDTTKFMKNYPGAFKELVENKNDLVKQFKALYGAGNTMGVFENESGLYDTKKGLKNSKFLKGISNLNEIIELAPRYAEFKTSLENGASIQEAMYNAREITTNFSRGGVITKALNRNGFTFLNASVQGLSKFIRNFSGENGARGIANSLIKAAVLGIAPALFNELAFGIGDDKDEEYEALPDYIKDNYYIIKTGDGNFVRLPKGRMLSVFGSAARRTIELAEGEKDAFEGYLKNANNQIGINDPEENNIFAPFIQAFGSENGTAWYGGDIVPSRLQNKPVDEQYDASTDKMSIWLGQRLGISPYKLNYVLDQYSGGIGDIVLPMITDEATSEGGLLAPIKDQFTADSTTDNKYVSDFYSKSDELKVKANSSKATDEDILRSQYMSGISSEMAKLYAERRNVQANNSLTKAEKYEKSQEIKKEINRLAKYGLDSNENISVTGNYAQAGEDMGYYKNAKGKWTPIDQKDIVATESIGLTDGEKSTYYGVKNDMYNIDQKYESKLKTASDEEKAVLNAQKKVDIINAIKETNLPDEAKAVLYDKKYASTETLDALLNIGIDFDSYLDLEAQNFTADKNIYGKTINGSKKSKVYNYINNLNMDYDKKIMLAKLYYKSDNTYNREIINSLNSNPGISYDEMKQILKAMGMKIDDYGQITW